MTFRSFGVRSAILGSVLALAPPTAGDDTAAVRVLAARVGETSRGIPRVVFEMERTVPFFAVELTDANGFDLHLTSAELAEVRAPQPAGAVRGVTFRRSDDGMIARVVLDDMRRVACVSTLTNPPRIVLDLPAMDGRLDVTAPALRKTPYVRASASRPAPPASAAAPATTVPATATSATPADAEVQSLLEFAEELRATAGEVVAAEDGVARGEARRRLSRFLAAQGMLQQAERMLLPSPGHFAPLSHDSLRVAELRADRGDAGGAVAIATKLDASKLDHAQRLSLADILVDGAAPSTVPALVEPVLATGTSADRARAALLAARSHWDQGRPAEALPLVAAIATSPATPADVLPGAVLLEADCQFALGRPGEARVAYERAAQLPLGADEASWASLQLGNLARREGRLETACRHYEATTARWPETFYANQAEWFLRFDERLRSLRVAAAERARG